MSYPNIIENYTTGINNLESKKVNLIDLVNLIYPIGSIYMSVNNVSPEIFLGGTWEQIKDKFLLSAGDTYSSGSTGGTSTVVLTNEQMPNHTHIATSNSTGTHNHNVYKDDNFCACHTGNNNAWKQMLVNVSGDMGTNCSATHSAGEHSHTITVNSSGSGEAHDNMPPYLAVYMWKRIS